MLGSVVGLGFNNGSRVKFLGLRVQCQIQGSVGVLQIWMHIYYLTYFILKNYMDMAEIG